MSQKMFHMAPALNVPKSIREDDSHHSDEQPNPVDKKNRSGNGDDDLIFGALDDEKSPGIDEGIHLHSNDEHANSSSSTIDYELDSMLPITDAEAPSTSIPRRFSLIKSNIIDQVIGMSNFRLKNRSKGGLFSNWKGAARKVGNMVDPWLDFKIDQYPQEVVIRHDFDPIKRIWNTKEIKVKVESKPFGNGSMRECFRLKKLEESSTNPDWEHASNHIAKRYIEDVPMARYSDDVMMQMTTKLWAARYNQHNPPKKVDIVQMCVLEFKDRPGRPFYHLEPFIEGKYIKYNSNSGFVCDDALRHTPHAFSHFTFEASCHEQIVVDIQGVGDLYTDPQIHTSHGVEYGEGNLGTRGMALFFYTHECNPICSRLNLTQFDLSSIERERQIQQHLSSPTYGSSLPASTTCRGSEEPLNNISRLTSLMRRLRSQSSEDESDGYISETSSLTSSASHLLDRRLSVPAQEQSSTKTSTDDSIPLSSPSAYSRSTSELGSNMEDIYKSQVPNNYGDSYRASSVALEKVRLEQLDEKCESILGKIHLEICKCYQVGRFSDLGAEEYDEQSALFHLEQATELNIKEAIFTLAKIYLDLPRDLLPNYSVTTSEEILNKGLRLMLQASELAETDAHLFLAQIYDKGVDGSLEPNWGKAVQYYEKYIEIRENECNANVAEDGEDGGEDLQALFNEQHDIVARLATLYKTGGCGINCNYQKAGDLFNKAAEMATAAMKGRLANKYYQAAEEAYAMEPEEES